MFPVTRRELLGRTVLGVQILLLAACGGDDDDKDDRLKQPRTAPDGPAGLRAKACQGTGHAEACLGSRSICRRSRKVHQAME